MNVKEFIGMGLAKSAGRAISGIAVALFASAVSVSASSVTYDFGQLSGGTPPAGSPPWVQAVFSDTGMPANTVQLTLNAGNLSGSEFVSCWYFNLNPALDPANLSFAVSGSGGSFTDPTISAAANGFKAGPDGKFDFLLGFTTTGSDASRFTSGDSLTLTITGISGLTVDDFAQLSTAAGGSGSYASAAHIQSIAPNDGSAWINPTATISSRADTSNAVPDGSTTITLLGASLLGIQAVKRKIQSRLAAQR